MITPSWTAPAHIKAFSTTRAGGLSQAPYSSNNLGMHVGDDPLIVADNRATLNHHLPSSPVWLDQQHTTTVIDLVANSSLGQIADGSNTLHHNLVCCVMTADCLPI